LHPVSDGRTQVCKTVGEGVVIRISRGSTATGIRVVAAIAANEIPSGTNSRILPAVHTGKVTEIARCFAQKVSPSTNEKRRPNAFYVGKCLGRKCTCASRNGERAALDSFRLVGNSHRCPPVGRLRGSRKIQRDLCPAQWARRSRGHLAGTCRNRAGTWIQRGTTEFDTSV
jgi:hypothetical protein